MNELFRLPPQHSFDQSSPEISYFFRTGSYLEVCQITYTETQERTVLYSYIYLSSISN